MMTLLLWIREVHKFRMSEIGGISLDTGLYLVFSGEWVAGV